MPNTTLNISFSGDENYLKNYAPTLIANLSKFYPAGRLHFYGMTTAMSDESQSALKQVASHFGQTYDSIIFPETAFDRLRSIKKGQDRWGVEAFFWMLAGEYMPDHVKRTVFVDLDVMAFQAIDAVYNASFTPGKVIKFFHSEGAFVMPAIVKKLKGEPISEREQRAGDVGNSGVILMDLDGMRQAGINERFFDKYIDEIEALPPFYQDWQIFGDQGLAHYALDDYFELHISNLVIHSLNYASMVYKDETSCLIHFAGRGVKSHKLTHEDIYDYGFSEITAQYLADQVQAKLILDPASLAVEHAAMLTNKKALLLKEQRIVGLVRKPQRTIQATRTWGTFLNRDQKYYLKNDRKFQRFSFETLQPLELGRDYRLTVNLGLNKVPTQKIRVLGFNLADNNVITLAELDFGKGYHYHAEHVFKLDTEIHSIGFASTDFPGAGTNLDIFKLKLEY